jgi:hypothetical protein
MQKQSYCFNLQNGTRVIIDPTPDERVIFTIIPIAGQPEAFTYREQENIMEDHLRPGSFSLSNDNQLAIITYLKKKAAGELEPCKSLR